MSTTTTTTTTTTTRDRGDRYGPWNGPKEEEERVRGYYTGNADVVGLQVGLEVLGARLCDRVHRGDEQRAVLPVVARVADVGRDVGVAAHDVAVVAGDAAAGLHAAVERSADVDDVVERTARVEALVAAVVLQRVCTHNDAPPPANSASCPQRDAKRVPAGQKGGYAALNGWAVRSGKLAHLAHSMGP